MKYANYCGYSDVRPFEVIREVSEKCMEIRAMDSERNPEWKPEFHAGGFAGNCANQDEQEWIISSNEEREVVRIRYSKAKRQWQDKHGRRFRIQDRPVRFHDYNF